MQADVRELTVFLEIARHLNFRRAAGALGVTPSALSHSLRGLEEKLGLRLVHRTTRSVALTAAGERLAERLRPAFRDIDDALDDLNTFREAPVGKLRISAARVAIRLSLLPVLGPFLEAHPGIEVEVVDGAAFVDIVKEGFDAGVRFHERVAADMVAIPLGPPLRSAIVATPAYFAKHPPPKTPRDLAAHDCIQFRFTHGSRYAWELERDGKALEVETRGSLTLSDQVEILEAALAGLGLAYVFESQVESLLRQRRLVRVLEDWCPSYAGFFLYYPSRRHLPPVLKAFVDFVRART
ncbi:LysR family transcriptional regulator [Corallococcus llansteffanensis]|uniref:LysR family transcriptional regulator n=1 Tax=Corallococcus llansteffanensis TaxID=2316731 RepID=A0A3A8N5P4_9BACT|nr:LysR family transcriptional regulator [Corallococcus llansteffanensis]RKH39717.1 LysR family transcriptional regulator [Corallococcus llansteffanensis]